MYLILIIGANTDWKFWILIKFKHTLLTAAPYIGCGGSFYPSMTPMYLYTVVLLKSQTLESSDMFKSPLAKDG